MHSPHKTRRCIGKAKTQFAELVKAIRGCKCCLLPILLCHIDLPITSKEFGMKKPLHVPLIKSPMCHHGVEEGTDLAWSLS